ncbi:MAG: Spy/CpxP family protein refolding chaperone [Bacteroidales bacterium]|nr:Spy/CpxP family protein refolding chaperone [Bacteroidales bacterium]
MKKKLIAVMVVATLIAGTNSSLFAQQEQGKQKMDRKEFRNQEFDGNGPRMMCYNLPGITESQKQQIKDLRTANLGTQTQLRNRLAEKRAHLNTLQAADEVDMKAINLTIDEMSALRTTIQKNSVALNQEIRKLLTDEQKTIYDARKGKRKSGHNNHGKQMMKDGKKNKRNW